MESASSAPTREDVPKSAADAFAGLVSSLIKPGDLAAIRGSQNDVLETLRSCNASLEAFNEASEADFLRVQSDFVRYTRVLKEAQGDLSEIFRRIRTLRNRIKDSYPEACPKDFDDDLLVEEKPDHSTQQ